MKQISIMSGRSALTGRFYEMFTREYTVEEACLLDTNTPYLVIMEDKEVLCHYNMKTGDLLIIDAPRRLVLSSLTTPDDAQAMLHLWDRTMKVCQALDLRTPQAHSVSYEN